ncbi:MAG TPA: glycosyltransferase, partial [Gemmataceae bacterium]|nr:glycosyltransferase [Gemmataceae bacterium]
LLTDAPRYALTKIYLCLRDWLTGTVAWLRGRDPVAPFSHCPSVCAIIAGYNEADTISATLASVWRSYPKLEIIVVDDGSKDAMAANARRFAANHDGILVLSRPDRGGKSSAMNFALRYSQAEVVIVIDADSELGPNAIWEIVQPLADERVGAVAGTVVVRNPFASLATWLQAYEYLSTIFVGRMSSALLNILGIVSGAFGAFRRCALDKVHGWDVGPPEDLDLTLALRKAGYQVAFAPYSLCWTEAPESFWTLIKQRRRWERSGAVRNHCRKHLDLAFPWTANFRFGNFFVLLESWFFSIFCLYGILAWFISFLIFLPEDWWQILLTLYMCYLCFEIITVATNLFYTTHFRKDLLVCSIFFLSPLYQCAMLFVRLFATTEELLFRTSFKDNYVPPKVRQATWHW